MEKVEEAIKSIPEKKENLRKAWDSLRSYSSSLPQFNFQWKEIEDHFSSIEKSIEERLAALPEKREAKEEPDAHHAAVAKDARPTLRCVCAKMNAKALRSYIYHDRQSTAGSWKDLVPAIRSAPDPALLVLRTIEGAYSDPNPSDHRRTSATISLLEKLRLIAPYIAPLVTERAKILAADWMSKLPMSSASSDTFAYAHALCLLHLIASYRIGAHFPLDDVMHLIASVSRSPLIVYFVKSLGLIDKIPDLIQKLISKGRHLDAVKFAYAFDVVDKFPPVPLLKAYVTESNKKAQEIRKKGNNSMKAENEATERELSALTPVLKVVEKYNLGTEYPRETLVERIAQLEGKKADYKRIIRIAQLEGKKADYKRIIRIAQLEGKKADE